MQLEQARFSCCRATPTRFPPLPAGGDPLTRGPVLLRFDHLIMLATALALSATFTSLLYRSRFGPCAARVIGPSHLLASCLHQP